MFGDYFINTLLSTFVLDKYHPKPEEFLYVTYPTGESQAVNGSDIPEATLDRIRIVVVGDTHDRHHTIQNIPACDLFIHCGDILMVGRVFSKKDTLEKLKHFNNWLGTIPAKKKIVVAGNHDHHFITLGKEKVQEILHHATYLENEGIEYRNVKLWGTPLSHGKSENRAFQTKDYYDKTMEVLPHSTDILITHGPYYEVQAKVKHKLHFCGHKHNSYGVRFHPAEVPILSICAPIHDGRFRLKHLPVLIDFPIPSDTSTSEKVGTSVTGLSESNIAQGKTTYIERSMQTNSGKFFTFSFIGLFWSRNQSRKVKPVNLPSEEETD